VIFYLFDRSAEDPGGPAGRQDDRPGSLGTPGDPVATSGVLIYSVGRRCATRRAVSQAQGRRPGQRERSRLDRRKGDRRQFSRISLIADIPADLDDFAVVGMGGAHRPDSGRT
jgi:hypothetical protein